MPERLTLYVCSIDEGGPPPHACKRVQRALRESGHDYEKVVFARGIPFGLFTTGRRPELKALSGQEKLPVLVLADGSTVNGSKEIIAWAHASAPSTGAGTAPASG
jgi:glutathione S-transferase